MPHISGKGSVPIPFLSRRCKHFKGEVTPPGDKSISHRSLIIGSQAIGTTTIEGLLESADIHHTLTCLQHMGITIHKGPSGKWQVRGKGVGGLSAPDNVLDMGNSGTGVRLLMGLVSTHPFTSIFTGDESLRKRPMARIITPLEQTGAVFSTREGNYLPIEIKGTETPLPIHYTLPVASAQVKSAILLAGLNCFGNTTVYERTPTRNHTECMLKGFGAPLTVTSHPDGGQEITLTGHASLTAQDIVIPSDPSSAAFLCVAALLTHNSEITIRNVGTNPTRTGLYLTLQEMGAKIIFENKRVIAGEEVADMVVRTSTLKGVTVPPGRVPSMIDEFPILGIAAAASSGSTTMAGLEELKVKESNRLSAITEGLQRAGVNVHQEGDNLVIHGGEVPGGTTITTYMDHRIAMSFLVLGMIAEKPITVDDISMIDTSFPHFISLMNTLGAEFHAAE